MHKLDIVIITITIFGFITIFSFTPYLDPPQPNTVNVIVHNYDYYNYDWATNTGRELVKGKDISMVMVSNHGNHYELVSSTCDSCHYDLERSENRTLYIYMDSQDYRRNYVQSRSNLDVVLSYRDLFGSPTEQESDMLNLKANIQYYQVIIIKPNFDKWTILFSGGKPNVELDIMWIHNDRLDKNSMMT